jgi:hypothetical protein
MLRSLIRLALVAGVAVVAAVPLTASAAGGGGGGSNNGMTVSVGSPITLQNKLLVTVPVTVTCIAELDSPGGGGVFVAIQQANGKQVSHGFGSVELDSCSPAPQTFLIQVVPDIQPVPSGPFKGGSAIAQASGDICDFGVFPQTCYSGSTDWTPIKL